METIYKAATIGWEEQTLETRITELEKYVIEIEERTWLVSDSLIKRSLAVWWHLIMIYLMFLAIVVIIVMIAALFNL